MSDTERTLDRARRRGWLRNATWRRFTVEYKRKIVRMRMAAKVAVLLGESETL